MARTDVNTRWQSEMAEFFTGIDGRPPDEGLLLLTEVFHLEDQVSTSSTGRDRESSTGRGLDRPDHRHTKRSDVR
jgi:L-rhamnose mutarotase